MGRVWCAQSGSSRKRRAAAWSTSGRVEITPASGGTASTVSVVASATTGMPRCMASIRWTSLGLSLLEAMHLAMPVVALATTETVEAVPPEAGVISTRPHVLHAAARRFLDDPDWGHQAGKAARASALARYGLNRFLADWNRLLAEVIR